MYVDKGLTSICTIVCHRLGKVGTIYWFSIFHIYGRQMCARLGRGRLVCGAFGIVVPSAMLCVVIVVVSTVLLTTDICIVW